MEKRNKSAKVLAVLTSGRKKGFTSGLLEKAIEGIENKNVNVDFVWLPKFNIKPCIACFNCIRDDKHVCTINDDMGKKGEGELFKKVQQVNAIFIADPVYFWGATSPLCFNIMCQQSGDDERSYKEPLQMGVSIENEIYRQFISTYGIL